MHYSPCNAEGLSNDGLMWVAFGPAVVFGEEFDPATATLTFRLVANACT